MTRRLRSRVVTLTGRYAVVAVTAAIAAAVRGGIVRTVRLLILVALVVVLTLMLLNVRTGDTASAVFWAVAGVVIAIFLAQNLTRR